MQKKPHGNSIKPLLGYGENKNVWHTHTDIGPRFLVALYGTPSYALRRKKLKELP